MDTNKTTHIETLSTEIIGQRNCGEVTFKVKNRSAAEKRSVTVVLDAFVNRLGFTDLGTNWNEIDRHGAEVILRRILHRDLAYNAVIMSIELAGELSAHFLDLFTTGARYFTNGTFYEPDDQVAADVVHGASWHPITDATFDTGVICLDEKRIGIVWVQDED